MAGACFQCVNDNGGINGRPVQFIMEEETQVDPQQIAALANKLVEEDGVLGIVGSTAINDCNVNEEFYENEGLFPIIAGVDLKCFQSPQFSSINMGPYYSNLGDAQGAVSAGAKGMLVVVSPEQLGDSNSGTVEFAQSMGLKTVSLLEDVPLAEPEELAEKLVQTARPGRRRGARFYRLDGPAIAPGNSEEASHRRRSLGELNSRL
ncbi:MAG: ABC transporter substrate-binding protein [Acetobacteraceae bacterium]|nr:ABC transporter substrate-binding protein [Acetobacteraceae bacterium]